MNIVQAFAHGMGVKKAAPRAVKEWRNAMGSDVPARADQIAQGYAKGNLQPRYLKDIHDGGLEAAVDLQIGRAGNIPQRAAPSFQERLQQFKRDKTTPTSKPMSAAPNESGYIARKMYKPDSPVSRDAATTKLLDQKQEYTDSARALSPEAKEMVPDMYGHKTLNQPLADGSTVQRHTSQHEYVPGAKSLKRSNPEAVGRVADAQMVVTDPMRMRGKELGDTPWLSQGQIQGNASNVAVTPQGKTKVLDFLPQGEGRAVVMSGDRKSVLSAYDQHHTNYGKGTTGALRKEVFRPTHDFAKGPGPAPRVVAQAPSSSVSSLASRAPAAAPQSIASNMSQATAAVPSSAGLRPASMMSQAAAAVPASSAVRAASHAAPIERSIATAAVGKAKGLIGRAAQFATKVHK